MVQEDWRGFGIRLGRAIDRWPGGGQRKFARELKEYADRHGIEIPTSYRTLVNYLTTKTRPSVAWVDAAAAILGQSAEGLLSGLEAEPRRPDDWAGLGVNVAVDPESAPRTEALALLVLGEYLDLPWEARWIIHGFASFFFANDTEGWDEWQNPGSERRADVERLVREYFGPLRHPRAAKMGEVEIMALTASLAASAYLQLASENVVQNRRGFDPAAALADLKRRQPPGELDLADLNHRHGEKETPNA